MSDPGHPVAGASLRDQERALGDTDGDGKAVLTLTGREGDAFDVKVTCPEGFVSPTAPLRVLLRTYAERERVPQYEVLCPPTLRNVVIAIRTDGAPALSVKRLGREVVRTDPGGTAHLLLTAAPGETVDLTLDTSEVNDPWLLPKSPTLKFVVGTTDEVVVMNQHFWRNPPVTKVIGKQPPCRIDRAGCNEGGKIATVGR